MLRIQGSGAVQPELMISSDEIDRRIGKPVGWTAANFAILKRGVASAAETSSIMAAAAARAALDAARWEAKDLDVIVGACGVMEQAIPGTAPLIQRRLGLGASGIPAFDINATCLSFLVALDIVSLGFAAGHWRKAMIASADIASAALNFEDPEASVIFGDGAAAIAVETVESNSDILAYRLETYGDGAEYCQLEAGGTRLRPHENLEHFLAHSRFQMDGPGVFMAAAKRFPRFASRLLKSCDLTPGDIDLVVPHQASAAALEHLRRVFPIGDDRIVDIFADHGNQIATSLPSALHAAITSGRLKRGDIAFLVGTAAGISLGGAIIRY